MQMATEEVVVKKKEFSLCLTLDVNKGCTIWNIELFYKLIILNNVKLINAIIWTHW